MLMHAETAAPFNPVR